MNDVLCISHTIIVIEVDTLIKVANLHEMALATAVPEPSQKGLSSRRAVISYNCFGIVIYYICLIYAGVYYTKSYNKENNMGSLWAWWGCRNIILLVFFV